VRMEVRRGPSLITIEVKLTEWPKGIIPPTVPTKSTPTKPNEK